MNNPINLVQQIDDQTCVHACLAMVTGCSIQDVVDLVGPTALDWRKEYRVLIEHGLFPYLCPDGIFLFPGVYIATIPSRNHAGFLHRIVVRRDRRDQILVTDPQHGRDGCISLGHEELAEDGTAFMQLVYLDPGVL